MNRKLVGGLAVVVVLLAGWWFGIRRRHAAGTAPPATAAAGSASAPSLPSFRRDRADKADRAPRGMVPRWSFDEDPVGPLRLEGQVLAADGGPAGGVTVWLDSAPPRSTKTEADGSFAFDKLVGREYSVTAESPMGVGGPVTSRLTETSDPVVIHLTEGAKLDVHVATDKGDPVANAEVKLASIDRREARTDGKGHVMFAPVRPGWVAATAVAPGYAPGNAFTTLGSAGATAHLEIKLHPGLPVSGHVLDEAGKPVSGAHVALAGPWGAPQGDPVTTDASGAFKLAAVAAGTHTLRASDRDHAPASSSPITVADRAVTGIEIRMKAGGVLAGTVVDADGKPVRFATVRAMPSRMTGGYGGARAATTDDKGAFELRGLARTKLEVRAESDTGASKVDKIDLAATAARRDLKLVLDVSGTISGIVVDDQGAPVPEVQVNAFPDFMAGNTSDSVALAGMSSATTDGGGRFAVHGLPDGTYRLWASRDGGASQAWGERGQQAKPGDTNVKITLSAPGELVGKLALESTGQPPTVATIEVGFQPGTPAAAGAFDVKELTPGNYDVRIVGPEFAEHIVHGVKIDPGKPTDLGTITLTRGRKLVGTVVDANGSPVPGVKVRLGRMLFSMAGEDDAMESFEEQRGMRVAVTDQDGGFAIIGVPRDETNVAASDPDRGSSLAQTVPPGTDDPPPVKLVLRGFGSIAGKVTRQGQPVAGAMVSDSPKGGGAQMTMARTNPDGSFELPKAVEGEHVLNAMQSGGLGMSLRSTSVTVSVTAGQATTVAIDIPVGTITLTVQVRALPNNEVDAAQVFLFAGAMNATNASQLTQSFLQGSIKGMKIWFGGASPMPAFDQLVPGAYTECTVPITGKLSDPTFMQRVQENMALLKVYCQPVTLAPSPNAQSVVASVPTMVPLPDPNAGSGSGT